VDNIQHLFCRVANIIHPQMAEKPVYTNLPVLAIASIETLID